MYYFQQFSVLKCATKVIQRVEHCSTPQVTLRLIPNAKPIFCPKKPIPCASVPLIDAELERLEHEGGLSPISYSAWAAPIVVVKKAGGSIRISTDFSTGPINNSEWRKMLREARSGRCLLLTININRGLFQYNRLSFGVKMAPDIFSNFWTPFRPAFLEWQHTSTTY
ncbi:unnamed protein product [Mesocestoides corti]|uniref:Reverse transcriptase domain-containing protein n=1 Tax=Mesocestoides corti TaxID=53468 RepID=A0A0R3UJC9_MESCO|nr:unnamed protein product [Mesocestoides corti]